jgi:sugar O-acyltransferase (sialic acid O-acetyltransferase NeuD family)
MNNLVIIGVGGFAREVYWHAQNSIGYGTEWMIKGFLDGTIRLADEQYKFLDAPLLGNIEQYEIQENDVFVCAVANPPIKMMLTEMVEVRGGIFINIIHNTAMVSSRAILAKGIILCPYTIISCNVTVGNHVMFNLYSDAGHDAVIGNYTSVMGHVDITGNVQIGERTYWGSGSRALPHSKIGNDSTVGAGSVVIKKVKANQTVFGIPAMPIL